MRDGTIAIAPEKPRGAQRLTDYLKTLNSEDRNTTIKSSNPIVANALKACNGYNEYIPKGWKRDTNYGNFKKGDCVLLERKIYKIVDDFKYSDEVPVQPLHGGKTKIRNLLHAVGIVKNSDVATNSGIQFTQHDIYANLNIAQNRIVNAINLGSHLEEPFKSKLAPGIAKLKQINTDLGRAISNLAMAYKTADKE